MREDVFNFSALYNEPFPSTRTGALFNAFSYPTKISPESVALFIACHTNVGDTILDPFGGSGTTGIAALLCDCPTQEMLDLAKKYHLSPNWGPRKAIVYEISTIGCLLGDVLCHTNHIDFEKYAKELLNACKDFANSLYSVKECENEKGFIRYTIWSDMLKCPNCNNEIKYSQVAIRYNPLSFTDQGICPFCNQELNIADLERVKIKKFDPVLKKEIAIKKRVPFKIYGETKGKKWERLADNDDLLEYETLEKSFDYRAIPNCKIHWGELYRQGYHFGITHVHHFYTTRNAVMFSHLWAEISKMPSEIQNALKVFLLSYNTSHSTLMTRVVAKKNNKDFVLTGAQPGVLYISSLPVEKNIYLGLQRKLKTFVSALSLLDQSHSEAVFINKSSTSMDEICDESVDYIFTDPPFGDYIPYSEINQINEYWLGTITDNDEEVIINNSQGKSLESYSNLMCSVFQTMTSKLKGDGCCTLVFHSAKAEIWRAIIQAYINSGLSVNRTSILNKVQSTFKQTNSSVIVKGDPIILLEKARTSQQFPQYGSDIEVAEDLLGSSTISSDADEKDKGTKLFSKYIIICIENGLDITLDAKYFFEHDKEK